MSRKHTAKDVRARAATYAEINVPETQGMLTAYAAMLERQAAGVTDEVAGVAQHIATVIEYIEKGWPNAKQLDRGPILRNMRRWRDRLLAVWPVAAEPVAQQAARVDEAMVRRGAEGGWNVIPRGCAFDRTSDFLQKEWERIARAVLEAALSAQPAPVVMGADYGSPDGDCAVEGHRNADGSITVDKVTYAKPAERQGECMTLTAAPSDDELPGTWSASDFTGGDPDERSRAERQGDCIDPAANWPEDAGTENGDYECVCATCGRHFIGYKRRVTCRLCSVHPAPPVGGPDGYYLASFKHTSPGGYMQWWMSNDSGYTPDLAQAGIYAADKIKPGYHDSEHTVPVPVALVDKLRVRRVVDVGDTLNSPLHSAEALRTWLALFATDKEV